MSLGEGSKFNEVVYLGFPNPVQIEALYVVHLRIHPDKRYVRAGSRSHLRDIRDRSVLRLFESTDGVTGMPGPLGIPGGGSGLPPHWEDQSYFSEPEFDSEYQHQHIHKSKVSLFRSMEFISCPVAVLDLDTG